MFPATITIHNASDLQKVMSVLYPTTGVVEITDKTRDVPHTNDADIQQMVDKAEAKVGKKEAKAADPKPTPAKTEQPAASQPTAEAEQAAAPETKAEPSAQADAPTLAYKDVQAAVIAAVKAGKRTDVVALLTKNGVDHAEKLKPEQWASVHAELTALVG